eukprot:TRINITY_DN3935_c0_g1_i1.p1 TRINITY_DN3935_c0_g1~~TRINITY_DN3935_c0_g1_i1.p1  ORF type:complete len:126 (+),score=19.92 TRINITY_DN3935_c0_g1_i1:163-540(+)
MLKKGSELMGLENGHVYILEDTVHHTFFVAKKKNDQVFIYSLNKDSTLSCDTLPSSSIDNNTLYSVEVVGTILESRDKQSAIDNFNTKFQQSSSVNNNKTFAEKFATHLSGIILPSQSITSACGN